MISIIADYFEPSLIEQGGSSVCPSDESQLSVATEVDYDAIHYGIVSVPNLSLHHEITDFH